MRNFDVIAVGDAIVDLFISLPQKSNHYHIDKEKNQLDLLLGEKNPVENSAFSLGGNATHLAIGLSRLGYRVGLAVEIGTDSFAQKILADLEKEQVQRSLLKQTPGTESSFTVSMSIANDRITFVHHVEREHKLSLDDTAAEWVYLTSMGEKWEDMYAKTLQFVKQTGAKLAFNPGSMQLKKGIGSFQNIIAGCNLLIVNKEEAEEILYGKVLPAEQKENIESVLFRLQRIGAKIVVITDGENGSFAIDEDSKVYTQPIFHEVVIEKTGAGDAFSTGFLAGLLANKDIQTCLVWGSANAAGVIAKHGGQEGLLTKQELEEKIKKEKI